MSDSKISRREIFEVAGALAVGAGAYELGLHGNVSGGHHAGSPTARQVLPAQGTFKSSLVAARAVDIKNPRLELVCHGMMMFHWVPDLDPNSLYILIPSPNMNGTQVHEICLTPYYGLVGNLLVDSGGSLQQGGYGLTVNPMGGGSFLQTQSLYPGPSISEEVVLHDPADAPLGHDKTNRIMPKTDTWNLWAKHQTPQASDPIWFSIKVPFPTQVYQYSEYNFIGPAYSQSGKTAKLFTVNPTSLAGIHVLFWENIDTGSLSLNYYPNPKSYQDPGPPTPVSIPSTGGNLIKLQLYAQPGVTQAVDYSHLKLFDAMAGYASKPLDLSDPATKTIPFANQSPQDIDSDLTPLDMWDLAWLSTGKPAPGFTTDPVECLQGWGT